MSSAIDPYAPGAESERKLQLKRLHKTDFDIKQST